MKPINLIYYDTYGNHVGKHLISIKKDASLPTHHLKNLIHHHLPAGYQITYNFIYPQKMLSTIYVAVQKQITFN